MVFILALILVSVSLVHGQLLTPTMACEMKCLQDAGVPSGITYDDPQAIKCREYCLLHAFDGLFGTTTSPEK